MISSQQWVDVSRSEPGASPVCFNCTTQILAAVGISAVRYAKNVKLQPKLAARTG